MTTTNPVEAQQTAILKCRVLRRPPSLGGMFYHLEPGQLVYILSNNGQLAKVATMPKGECIGEDYFCVAVEQLLCGVH